MTTRDILEEQIKAQGDLIRKLKADKEDKERVSFIHDYYCIIVVKGIFDYDLN